MYALSMVSTPCILDLEYFGELVMNQFLNEEDIVELVPNQVLSEESIWLLVCVPRSICSNFTLPTPR